MTNCLIRKVFPGKLYCMMRIVDSPTYSKVLSPSSKGKRGGSNQEGELARGLGPLNFRKKCFLKSMFASNLCVVFTVCNNDNKEMSTSENVNPFDILTCFNFHCVFAETFIIITLLGSNVCCTPFQIECCSSSWKCHTCTANTNLLIKFFSNFISK